MVRNPPSPKTLIRSITLSSFCQDTTRLILSSMSQSVEERFHIAPTEKDGSVHGDWMAVTIAQSSLFRLILKVNYRDEDALALALTAYETDKGLTIRQINDFVREYSNQIMGRLKSVIESHANDAKSSFTLVTRAEDYRFFSPNPAVPHYEDSWMVLSDQSVLQCSVSIEFTDASLMEKVQLPAFPDRAKGGTVEFFFE